MTSFDDFFSKFTIGHVPADVGYPAHLRVAASQASIAFQPQLEMFKVSEKLRFPQELINLISGLTEEVGEVNKAIAKISGYKKLKEGDKVDNLKDELASELADVLVYIFQLGNKFDIDVMYAFETKLNALKSRKYL